MISPVIKTYYNFTIFIFTTNTKSVLQYAYEILHSAFYDNKAFLTTVNYWFQLYILLI